MSILNTELKNSITATDKEAQYDASAKRLLGQKIILAHILSKTIPEFMGMKPSDIVSFIEGEPYISTVPVDPGLTNIEKEINDEHIVGLNGENSEINEGMIRFDIIFYVRIPSKNDMTDNENILSQIIINVEAQKSEPKKYDILNRAIFYVSRMISSQNGRDFENSDYNNIKDVNVMCNLSQGIKEVGIAIGETRGKAIGKAEGRAEGEATAEAKIVINMHNNGLAPEQIATFTNKDIDDVKAIISGNIPALAK